MKRRARKLKKLPLTWAASTEFSVRIRQTRAVNHHPALADKIVVLPLSDTAFYYPAPPPIAA